MTADQTDVPEQDADFEKELGVVVDRLMARARDEARQTDAWKDLFSASEGGLSSLLSEASRKCDRVVLDLCDVIRERFGLRISRRLYDLLRALPFATAALRAGITDEQGMSCCADKTRQVYYKEVLAEINRIKETESAEVRPG